jgi:Undecaprenyl-phosphate galactose phosphotransferase WbaP
MSGCIWPQGGTGESFMPWTSLILLFSDVTAFLTAFGLGGCVFLGIRHSNNPNLDLMGWLTAYLLVVAIAIFWFLQEGHYTRRWPFWDEIRGIFKIVAAAIIIEGALIFLIKSSFSRIWFVSSFSSIFVLLPLLRFCCKKVLIRMKLWEIKTVIIGTGQNAFDALKALHSEPMMGFALQAFWCVDPVHEHEHMGFPVESLPQNPIKGLHELGAHCVVVALENDEISKNGDLIDKLQKHIRDLYVVPVFRGVPLYGMEIHYFFRHEVLLMRVRNNLSRPIPRFIKRTFDIFISLLLIVLLSPLFAFLCWCVRKDKGPAFFGHERIGLKGKPFRCYKFRSMVMNAEEVLEQLLENDVAARSEWERDFKLKNDVRITQIGSFLRKSSLDELPQLWNVLKGDMSLVGPRPVIDKELARYGNKAFFYLEVRPGITGLWQVSGRNDIDYCHRVYLDVWYVKNWSIWYDIAILCNTFKVVFGKQGAY